MSDGAHLLVPGAASHSTGCREALRGLALPHLEKLLARLAPSRTDAGEEASLSMPHERALAREYGIEAPDGLIPWAAWHAAHAGRPAGDAWAWVTPCHWQVGARHVAMADPQELQLEAQHSRALLEAMQPWFTADGVRLEYDAPSRWLAQGEVFRQLPTASLDRVVGRSVDRWMPRTAGAAPLRRLQQEMQMLLYTHPVNDARAAAGLAPVNSFWASGTGALSPGASPRPPVGLELAQSLREPALRGDWAAWAAAWRQLDATACARLAGELDRGRPVRLTLCGERSAVTWAAAGGGWWQRLGSLWRRRAAADVLEAL